MTQENVCILKSSSQCLKRTESIKMICVCYLKPYEHLLHNRNMDQDIFGFGFFKTTRPYVFHSGSEVQAPGQGQYGHVVKIY